MQEARFSKKRYEQLAEPTVHSAMDYVAQTFWANDRPDPRHDQDEKMAYLLQHQFRVYQNLDPAENPQKALMASIFVTCVTLHQPHQTKQ